MDQYVSEDMKCDHCLCEEELDFDFTFAFQPIVDAEKREVIAQEALVRGLNGEEAEEVLSWVSRKKIYRFDRACRSKAVKLASALNLKTLLCVNFLPYAIYRPELCLQTTVAVANECNFDIRRLVLELTEKENVTSTDHLATLIDAGQEMGFSTALDDFGAGYSRLPLLIDAHPQFLKLDMAMVRDVHKLPKKQAVIKGTCLTMKLLGVSVIAEGVETVEEYRWLRGEGIRYYQGYLWARPGFECLPQPQWPD